MPDSPRPCPACGQSFATEHVLGDVAVNHYNSELLARRRYDAVECGECRLIFFSPLPSDDDIRAMYVDSHQFDSAESAASPYRGEQGTAVLEYTTGRFLAMLRMMGLDTGAVVRVLEVGAGLSWMCRAAKIATWDNITVAQDLTDEAVEECRWVDRYVVEDVMTSDEITGEGPYDVISLTHVFEHLAEPVAMLERLRDLLSDRGFIFITAPHRPYGWKFGDGLAGFDGWSYNHVPAHLQYFNREAFQRAAAASGLEVALFEDHHEGGQAFEGWLRRPAVAVS